MLLAKKTFIVNGISEKVFESFSCNQRSSIRLDLEILR